MRVELTPRDLEIIDCLREHVRLLSIDQIARTWWEGQRHQITSARKRMLRLAAANRVTVKRRLARKEIPVTYPVISFCPTRPTEPSFQDAARQLKNRWLSQPSSPVDIVLHPKAYSPRTSEVTHDIQLSAVYLHYRATKPELIKNWIPERVIRQELAGKKGDISDAQIRDISGKVVLTIECGGSYRAEKLKLFHEANKETPYVIW